MAEDDCLLLNLTTNTFAQKDKHKTNKVERLKQKKVERRAHEKLIESYLKPGSNIREILATASPKPSKNSSKSPSKPVTNNTRDERKRKFDGEDGGTTKRHKNVGTLFYNNPDIPKLGKTQVETVKEKVFSGDNFRGLGLHAHMVSNLEERMHMTEVTGVQKATIPHILSGKDVLVKSQTGSGKTLAYAVPIVQNLQEIRPKLQRADGLLALVIVPTRELALQSFDTFKKLVYPFTWIVPGCLMGGEKKQKEKARLRKGLNIVISTPGRFLDHLNTTKNLQLGRVEWLVIDEADRLLDMGFEKDVREIINALDEQARDKRKTSLISATLSAGVDRLAGMSLNSPIRIDLTGKPLKAESTVNIEEAALPDDKAEKFATPENLKHHCVIIPSKLRLATLAAFLLWKCKMAAKRSKILVFMSTQDAVDFHYFLFRHILIEDEEDEDDLFYRLHGDMEQKDRTDVFNKFSAAESGVLFCTDVAARGLDLPLVKWIVQFMPPGSSTDYIHRVGRTARIGSRGNALLFLTPAEAEYSNLLKDCNMNLIQVQMNHILQTLLTEKNRLSYIWDDNKAPTTIEEAASLLQSRFMDYVRLDQNIRTLARKAYQSYIGAYTAYPSKVKHIFHIKTLHLGHVATSFGLQEAPKKIGNIVGTQSKKGNDSTIQHKKVKSKSLPHSMHKTNVSEFSSGLDKNMEVPASSTLTRKGKKKLGKKRR